MTTKAIAALFLCAAGAFGQTAAYPGAVTDDAHLAVSANYVSASLEGGISAADTSFIASNVTRMTANMILTIEGEKVWTCAISTGARQILIGKSSCPNVDGRGVDQTSASVHPDTSPIVANVDRWHHESMKAEMIAVQTKLLREQVSVIDSGADPTGLTDSAARLNTALGTCKNLSFPAGTYAIGTTLNMACNQQHLIFDSGAIIRKSGAFDAIVITGSDNVVEGIVIDGNGVGASGIGITGLRNWIIRGEVRINSGHGIYLDGQTTSCGFNHVQDVKVHNNGNIGIAENHCGNNQIIDNYVYQNGLEGITIDNGSNNSVVSGNQIDHNCNGGGVGGIGVDTSSGWTVSGNIISNSQSGCSGLKTQNNLGNTGGGSINGNSIIQNAGFGIWLFTNGSNITFGSVTTGNQIFQNTGASYQADTGSSNNLFTGNAYDQDPVGLVTGVNLINQDILAFYAGGTRSLMDAIGRLQISGAYADQSYQRIVPVSGFVNQIDAHSGTYIIEPGGTLATGTIGFPLTPVDGQQLTVTTTQTITALNVAAGAPVSVVIKGPASYTLAANTSVKYMYLLSTNTWYKVR